MPECCRVDADDRIATVVVYDLEDFGAALPSSKPLCRRRSGTAREYVVGCRGFLRLDRAQRIPAMAADMVSIDHRRQSHRLPPVS